MKWRIGFLVCCAVAIGLATVTAATSPEVAMICCEAAAGCPGGQVCCDPEVLGTEPCDEELPGYCKETCKRVAGAATFTLDAR